MTDEHHHLFLHAQAAGIPKKLAPTIGICVDHRRRNRSEESLAVRDFRATRERDETNGREGFRVFDRHQSSLGA